MSYQVAYGYTQKPRKSKRSFWRKTFLAVIFLLTFLYSANRQWEGGTKLLGETFLPGDMAVATAAFENLVLDLEEGTELKDALQSFMTTFISEKTDASD